MTNARVTLWLNASLRQGFWAPALVLVFWALAAKGFAAYLRWPWLDMPTHFLGGVSAAYFIDVCALNAASLFGPLHRVFRVLVAFGLVAACAVFWEFAEYGSDTFLGSHLNLGVEDTLHDLAFGLTGGLCGALISVFRTKATIAPQAQPWVPNKRLERP
jgi:hypothetical protein